MDKVSEKVIKALDRLGYWQRKLRGRSLHARRGSHHLIIKLSKHGRVKSVKAHRDVKSGVLHKTHKAIYGKVAARLEDEFRMAYKNAKSSPRG